MLASKNEEQSQQGADTTPFKYNVFDAYSSVLAYQKWHHSWHMDSQGHVCQHDECSMLLWYDTQNHNLDK